MCIGIAFDVDVLDRTFLERFGLGMLARGADLFGSPAELRLQYNDPRPRLPVLNLIDKSWDLITWGNRDDIASWLPRTGWAREESIAAGKWNRFHPVEALIPAQRGCEKKVWFPIAERGIAGLIVRDESATPHVYMMTRAASPAYQRLTGHDREPVWRAVQW